MLALGICLVILAVTALSYALCAPPAARVPAGRRVAPGTPIKTPVARIVGGVEHAVDATLRRRNWKPFPALDLELAGILTPQATIVTAIGAFAFLAYMIGYVFGGVFVGIVAAAMVPVGARINISHRKAKRRRAFADQLESTLEVIVSALRAGHSFPSALDTVAADSQAPTAEEFARIVNEGRLGQDIVAAMHNTAERMESQDFGWVADAVAIQRDTGGNLTEILQRVGENIRARNELAKKVRALSAEGRISAWVMMAVPPVLGAYLAFMNGEMFKTAFISVAGFIILAFCLVLYLIGFFWIRKLVTVVV
ncbi:MAG TPA: type II secretion system F family protein [Aeromicrobium sp.]|nr:type II secretion system F family protein [Aeromicrobium sp.]